MSSSVSSRDSRDSHNTPRPSRALGDARLLVSEEIPQLDALSPATLGGTPMLQVLESRVVDPDGHRWALTTKREQVTPGDIDARTPRNL